MQCPDLVVDANLSSNIFYSRDYNLLVVDSGLGGYRGYENPHQRHLIFFARLDVRPVHATEQDGSLYNAGSSEKLYGTKPSLLLVFIANIFLLKDIETFAIVNWIPPARLEIWFCCD